LAHPFFLKEFLVSHVVQIQTQVRDPAAIGLACQRLELPAPVEGTFQLYTAKESGLGVQLRGWRYPVVCQPATGELKYDNFGGHWGAPSELDRFLQGYAVERARIEARRQGHTVTEQPLTDGGIKLTITIGA